LLVEIIHRKAERDSQRYGREKEKDGKKTGDTMRTLHLPGSSGRQAKHHTHSTHLHHWEQLHM
jgi:hypothetical protein